MPFRPQGFSIGSMPLADHARSWSTRNYDQNMRSPQLINEESVILVVTARPRPESLDKARSILVEAAPVVHQEKGRQL